MARVMARARPLNIVHVLRAPMGGVLRHVRDLARAQADMGHRVGLVCDGPGTAGYDEAMLEALSPWLALGLHRVPMARPVGPRDVIAARSVLGCLKKLAPDIVHGHGAKGGVYARAVGAMANRTARPARLYSPHGGSLHHDPARRGGRLYFAVERLLERWCETILFVAEYEARTYRAKIGIARCRTKVVHNGLLDAEFAPVTPAPGAADFLFIGEMRPLKGPDLFVDAIAALRSGGHQGVSAVMVGAGPGREAIAGRIAQAGLAGTIAMHDPMPARRAFALARTVVMPSRAEAMPYIVLEALGAGRPLIATRVGGVAEIMGTDSAALIEPALPALTDAMDRALGEPGWPGAQMPATDSLRARFSATAMATSVLAAYREALARVRPGAAVRPKTARPTDPSSNVS